MNCPKCDAAMMAASTICEEVADTEGDVNGGKSGSKYLEGVYDGAIRCATILREKGEPDATPAGPVVGGMSGVTAGETAPKAGGTMRLARMVVERHIEVYGYVPHPDKLKEAISSTLATESKLSVLLELNLLARAMCRECIGVRPRWCQKTQHYYHDTDAGEIGCTAAAVWKRLDLP